MLLTKDIICSSCNRNGVLRFDCEYEEDNTCNCPDCECLESNCFHENNCNCCVVCCRMIIVGTSDSTNDICSRCSYNVKYKYFFFGERWGQILHINSLENSYIKIHMCVNTIFYNAMINE